MSIRDLKNRSRLQLHNRLAFPAVFVNEDRSVETPCTIRYHDQTQSFGDMAGFDYAPAQRVESVPEVVVLSAVVTPSRGGIFSVASDEAYTVEVVMPRDGITITSQVTRMKQSEIDAAGLPLPRP